jgi:hypothetical protein
MSACSRPLSRCPIVSDVIFNRIANLGASTVKLSKIVESKIGGAKFAVELFVDCENFRIFVLGKS